MRFFLHIYYDLIGFFSYILESDRIFVDNFFLVFFIILLLATPTPTPTPTPATPGGPATATPPTQDMHCSSGITAWW